MPSPSLPSGKRRTRNDEAKKQIIGGRLYSLQESSSSSYRSWPRFLAMTMYKTITAPLMVSYVFLASVVLATPLRNTLFSMVLPKVMDKVDEEFEEERTILLSTIYGGSVLDVGSGAGAYFRYMERADRVVAVEPATLLHPILQKAAQKHGLFAPTKQFSIVTDLKDVVINDDDDNDHQQQFDHIILGNVLCEVPNVDETLDQIDALLRMGGRLYFSEHVGRPVGTFRRWIQDWYNPVHRHISVGCNCNRDSVEKIYARKNWEVASWKYEHLQVAMGPMILGIAAKKDL